MRFGDALATLVLGAAILWPARSQITGLFRSSSRASSAGVLVLVMLILGGHVMGRNRALYPWVTWDMFTARQAADAEIFDYTLHHESGREEPLRFPAGGLLRLRARLESTTRSLLRATGDDERTRLTLECRDLVAALVQNLASDDPVTAVTVWRSTFPEHRAGGLSAMRREPVHRVELR